MIKTYLCNMSNEKLFRQVADEQVDHTYERVHEVSIHRYQLLIHFD
jgi:hypothetical protein